MFFAYIEQLNNTIFVSCIKNIICFDNEINSIILEGINKKIKKTKYSGEYRFETLESFRIDAIKLSLILNFVSVSESAYPDREASYAFSVS